MTLPIPFRAASAPLLVCSLLAISPAGAQSVADTATAGAPDVPRVVLPLERSVYFVGEAVPVGAPVGQAMQLVDAAGKVLQRLQVTASALKLDTAGLAPGKYVLRSGTAETPFEVVSPLRSSPGALFDEVLPAVPWQDAGNPQKKAAAETRLQQAFEEAGIDGIFALGSSDLGHYPDQDKYARFGTQFWFNPYTRPISFTGAHTYEPELRSFTQKYALIAQANGRYPTFGGFQYHWDPVGFNRDGLLIYWNWNDQEAALKAYLKRSQDSIGIKFKQRTGMEPVTSGEFLRFTLAAGNLDLLPAFDLPTNRWLRAIAAKSKPMDATERASFTVRLDAWTKHLSGILGEANAYHSKWLKQIEPSMVHTSSHDTQFRPREGSWQPAAYKPLDFRFIEAWNDQIDGPDYIYQWFLNAALTDMERGPGQPTWVGTVLSSAHHAAPYPGRFMRVAAHNLAYGGRGIGLALEGFSNLVGGMNATTNWWNMKGTAGAEDLRTGREFLRRFAALGEQCRPVRKVGILFSLTQFGQQSAGLKYDGPQFNALINLMRTGYTPRFVTEDEIAAGGLQGFEALVVVNQTAALPQAVSGKLAEFTARGGRLLLSDNSTVKIPGSQALAVSMPYSKPGRPFNWESTNSPDRHPSFFMEERLDQLGPAFRAALGAPLRAPLVPEQEEKSRVSVLAMDGGTDAAYVVATNDSFNGNQSTWARQEVQLVPNGTGARGALYDLTDERSLGALAPVKAGFMDRTVRLYAVLARPVASTKLLATQQVTAGQNVVLSVSFMDAGQKPLLAAIPFVVKLTAPDGAKRIFYRSTGIKGQFSMELPTGANAPAGTYQLSVRRQLDGNVTTLPVEVRTPGQAPSPLSSSAPLIARGDIRGFLRGNAEVVLPVFEGPGYEERLAVANDIKNLLKAQKIVVQVRERPAIGVYTMGYDPNTSELAANAIAERGEGIGKIKRTTINQNDWFAVQSGYVFGKPLVLLDVAGHLDNPLAESLSGGGMLWPVVSSSYPGPGGATVQVVRSAFTLGTDTLIIQANDIAGLKVGSNQLAKLPTDWVTPGIEAARHTLAWQFSIGRTPEQATAPSGLAGKVKLTSVGGVTTAAPEPLKLELGANLPPLIQEVKAPQIPQRIVTELPGTIEVVKAALPFYQSLGKWTHAFNPGGSWVGDLRFSDATYAKVKVLNAGKYRVRCNGTFRYKDRTPQTQSTWEEIVGMYMNTVQPQRDPMDFEVLLNGKSLGRLSELTTAQKEVVTQSSTAAPRKAVATEEVVTAVEGEVELPAGEHELLFVWHNMVDGKLDSVQISAR